MGHASAAATMPLDAGLLIVFKVSMLGFRARDFRQIIVLTEGKSIFFVACTPC